MAGKISIAEVEAELGKVITRGLSNINVNRGSQKRLALPVLEGLAAEYDGDLKNENRISRIRTLIRAAVDLMGDADHRTRMIIRLGLRDDILTTSPYELALRARHILGESNNESAKREARARTAEARHQLSEAIFELIRRTRDEQRRGEPVVRLSELISGQPVYVRRDELHSQIDTMLHAKRVVVLSGERGTGKSRLAIEYVRENVSSDADLIYINGESSLTAAKDIAAILASHSIVCSTSSLDQLLVAFSSFLSSVNAPSWIIVDNIEDGAVLKRITPTRMRSFLIITSCVKLPSLQSSEIIVGSLEVDESENVVRSLLSGATETEVSEIARVLGRRVLPIVQMCGLVLADDSVEIRSILAEISQSPAAVLDTPRPFVDNTLTLLYEKTLESLSRMQGGDIAIETLASIAFSGPALVPRKMLSTVTRLGVDKEKAMVAESASYRAVLELESRFLVARVGSSVACHPLTHLLLRDMLSDKAPLVCGRMFHFLFSEVSSIPELDTLPAEALALAPHILSVVFEIMDRSNSQSELAGAQLDYVLAVGMHATLQSGGLFTSILRHHVTAEYLSAYPRSLLLWIQLQAKSQPMRWGEYVESIESALLLADSGNITTVHLPVEMLLNYLEALVDEGMCSRALAVIKREQDRLNFEDGANGSGPSASQYGNLLIILARVSLAIGDRLMTKSSLENAYAWFKQKDPTSSWSVTGRMKTLLYMVESSLIFGRSSASVGDLVQEADRTAESGKKLNMVDVPTSARYMQLHGRGLTYLLYNLVHRQLQDKSSIEIEPGSDIDQLADACIDFLKKSVDYYSRAALQNESDEVAIDLLIVEVLSCRRSLSEASGLLMSGSYVGSHAARQRGAHLILKLMIVLNPACGHIEGGVRNYDKFAYAFADKQESVYWYSEYLIVAAVLAALQGDLVQSPRLKALKECLDMIGRVDKWNYLMASIESCKNLPERDFVKSFSYFLNW